jgi:hypothetical protein
MVESQPSAPPPVEEAPDLEQDLAVATASFDVHAWFEAYLREPEVAEHPGVPYN